MEELALHGGKKAKASPYRLPNLYGQEELDQLRYDEFQVYCRGISPGIPWN